MNLFINAYIKNKLSSELIFCLNSTYYYMLTKLMTTASTVFIRLQGIVSMSAYLYMTHVR